MSDIILELQAVSREYRAAHVRTLAVKEASLAVRRGDYLAIEGPSGGGKTTLLSMMGLLEPPTAGSIRVLGEDVRSLSGRRVAAIRNRHLGFVFQTFNLLGDRQVLDNVALPLKYAGVPRRQRHERASELLDQLGLWSRANHYPAQLSGGQQQRVAIARALINEPDLILADEPTGNLDEASARGVIELLESLHERGTSICLVTHSRAIATRAMRRLRMQDGQLFEDSQSAVWEVHQ